MGYPMKSAPKCGRHILIRRKIFRFVAYGKPYKYTGENQIVECYWDKEDEVWRIYVGEGVITNDWVDPLEWCEIDM